MSPISLNGITGSINGLGIPVGFVFGYLIGMVNK
jgi:hypothetical protein